MQTSLADYNKQLISQSF